MGGSIHLPEGTDREGFQRKPAGETMAEQAASTLFCLFLPFLAALLAPLTVRSLGHRAGWLLALAPALAFIQFLGFLPQIADGGVVTGGYAWVPSLNLSFSWFLDGLSLTFALLITGIGTLIVIYSGGYMKGHPQQGRFLAFVLLFMGAMLGLVVSDSFLMLFVYWRSEEHTSELQSIMRISYAVFCLKKKQKQE